MSTISLHLGDCRDVLKTIEPGSVDALVMDPPYGISHSSNHGASWQDTKISGDEDTTLRDLAIAWAEKHHLPWAAFGTWKQPTPPRARGVLVWDKGPAFGMGDLSFPWKPSWEEIAVGGPGWSGKRDEAVLRNHVLVSWESKGRQHPHQKPVSLIVSILKKLPGIMTVVDPFAGSGPTALACIRLGLNFVGCEIDPHYHAIAEKRIAAERAKMSLFAGIE